MHLMEQTYVEAEEVLGGGVEQRDLPAGLLLDVGAAQTVTGAAGSGHQQRSAGHRPPLQQEQGHEGHDACAGKEASVTVGTEPAVVVRAAADDPPRVMLSIPRGGEHPRGGCPARAATHTAPTLGGGGVRLDRQPPDPPGLLSPTAPVPLTCPPAGAPPPPLPAGCPTAFPHFATVPVTTCRV